MAEDTAPGREMAKQATKDKKLWITADHSKFDALNLGREQECFVGMQPREALAGALERAAEKGE